MKFRLANHLRFIAIAMLGIFLTGVGWSVSLFFLKDPKAAGFVDRQSLVQIATMCISIFGLMALLAGYLLTMYCVQFVAFEGDKLMIRSVFQKRQICANGTNELKWIAHPNCGIRFVCGGQKTALELASFSDADRLQMIRLARNFVAHDRQMGWPLFCHKVALPLRDDVSPRDRLRTLSDRSATNEYVLVTRRRYDVQAAVVLPITAAIGLFGLWKHRVPELMAFPIIVLIGWFALRFSIPRKGRRQPSLTRTGRGRFFLYLYAWLIITPLTVLPLCNLLGVSMKITTWIILLLMCPLFPVLFIGGHRIDKQRKIEDAIGAESAAQCWETSEGIAGR